MTADREERKYLLSADALLPLVAELSERLLPHRFSGEGANRLPDAHHFVTTVYFDTPSRWHYFGSIRNRESNVKVRAKEYYDIHPSLAELATDPAEIVRPQPWVWFELKRRDGLRTTKRRFRLLKEDVSEFFSEACRGRRLDRGCTGTRSEPLEDVVEHCRALGEPLSADCVANYRRASWQDARGALRVTVDVGLSFYMPPVDLWTSARALSRERLGAPRAHCAGAIVEVKQRESEPAWLREALTRSGAQPVALSKFTMASEAVHGAA
jgi:hypothetical protein